MKELERKLFVEGCEIMFETITSENKKIRLVRTLSGKEYKLIYSRNKNYVFVIDSVIPQ